MQGYGAGGTVNLEMQKPPWTWLSTGAFVMGRDPVSRAKRAKYKPPAMRVCGVVVYGIKEQKLMAWHVIMDTAYGYECVKF